MKRTRRLRITTHFAIQQSGSSGGPCPRCLALAGVAQALGLPAGTDPGFQTERTRIDGDAPVCEACARALRDTGGGPVIEGKVLP